MSGAHAAALRGPLPRDRSSQVFRALALDLVYAAALLMVLFQVVKPAFGLSGIWLLYPYLVAVALAAFWVPAVILRARVSRLPLVAAPHLAVLVTGVALLAYHVLALGELGADVLYSLRLYYGVFILTFGFVAFLGWLDPGAALAHAKTVRLIEIVIVVSFAIAAVEYIGLVTGLAGPAQFWWIQRGDINDIINYQRAGDFASIRPQGIAANASVLGAFTVFVGLYYYSQVAGAIRRRHVIVLACALATVVLTHSGVPVVLLVLAMWPLVSQVGARASGPTRRLIVAVALVLASVAVGYEFREGGRFSTGYFDRLQSLGGGTANFAVSALSSNALAPVLGAMNLRQFTKPDPEPFRWPGEVTYYDFSLLAFVIEFGLVGLGVYLFAWKRLVALAFPRGPRAARWAFWLLIVASLHYAVASWVCTQVVVAVVLASHCYAGFDAGRAVGAPRRA